jgi:hypothetical protein
MYNETIHIYLISDLVFTYLLYTNYNIYGKCKKKATKKQQFIYRWGLRTADHLVTRPNESVPQHSWYHFFLKSTTAGRTQNTQRTTNTGGSTTSCQWYVLYFYFFVT